MTTPEPEGGESVSDDLRARIREALGTYRCHHWRYHDQGGGMQLLDVLSPPAQSTGPASDELDLLADHIVAEITEEADPDDPT